MQSIFKQITQYAKWRVTVLSLCVIAGVASAGELAGTVVVVIGDATVAEGAGAGHAIMRGEKVFAGQTVTTGANGQVNLRMIDGASVIVRTSSRLRIEEYFVDTVTPSKSRIKLNLENGVVRSITGKAGEASKESYRLNTPLAAIGIRGTDFVVQANNEVTRVQVQSGAIVMTPLSGDCTRESLGPCKSLMSRDLTAAMHNAYLELRSRSEAPVFVPADKALDSPNLIAPPRTEEPKVSADKATKTGASNTEAAVTDAKTTAAVEIVKTQTDITPVKPEVKPVEVPVAARVWWGRWQEFASADGHTVQSQLIGDREIGVSNTVFGLVRENSDKMSLPNTGVFSFKLADSESYLMQADRSLVAAKLNSPLLKIDFGNRLYETSLSVSAKGMSNVDIQSQGHITFQGFLISDSATPDTTVSGALSQDGSQAGYLFQRMLTNGASVVGATRWIH